MWGERHGYPFCGLAEPGEQLLARPELSGVWRVWSDQIQRMTALHFHEGVMGGGRGGRDVTGAHPTCTDTDCTVSSK